jgi:excisionase family DNA binding protein
MDIMRTAEPEKLLLRIEEAAVLLSMGRAKAYQMAQSGQMPGVVRMGRSVRVSAAVLRGWVEGEAQRQNGREVAVLGR